MLLQNLITILPGLPTNEVNTVIETHPVTFEDEISKCPVCFKILQIFLCLLLINSVCFISSKRLFQIRNYLLEEIKCNELISKKHLFFSIKLRLRSSVIFVFKVLMYYLVIIFLVVRRK